MIGEGRKKVCINVYILIATNWYEKWTKIKNKIIMLVNISTQYFLHICSCKTRRERRVQNRRYFKLAFPVLSKCMDSIKRSANLTWPWRREWMTPWWRFEELYASGKTRVAGRCWDDGEERRWKGCSWGKVRRKRIWDAEILLFLFSFFSFFGGGTRRVWERLHKSRVAKNT